MILINISLFSSLLLIYLFFKAIFAIFVKFKIKDKMINYLNENSIEIGDSIKSIGQSFFVAGLLGFFIPIAGISFLYLVYIMFLGIIIIYGGIEIKKQA